MERCKEAARRRNVRFVSSDPCARITVCRSTASLFIRRISSEALSFAPLIIAPGDLSLVLLRIGLRDSEIRGSNSRNSRGAVVEDYPFIRGTRSCARTRARARANKVPKRFPVRIYIEISADPTWAFFLIFPFSIFFLSFFFSSRYPGAPYFSFGERLRFRQRRLWYNVVHYG